MSTSFLCPLTRTSRSWRTHAHRQPNTEAVHPKWIEHRQSGHLTKDKNCAGCVEEAGSRVAHWRKKADPKPGVTHVDLAAFEPSADGHKYCLVAAVTVEIDKESKLLPIVAPMPKRTPSADLQQSKKLSQYMQRPKPTPDHQLKNCPHRGTGTHIKPLSKYIHVSRWLTS